jgi:hypothetical protein
MGDRPGTLRKQEMTSRQLITREDLDAGPVDFPGLDTGERLPPVHPGDVLRHDFLEPLAITSPCALPGLAGAREPYHDNPEQGAGGDRRDGSPPRAAFQHLRGVLA